MGQLFDETINLVLNFSNPKKRDMQDADKLAQRLGAGLDQIVRQGLTASKSVATVINELNRASANVKSIQRSSEKTNFDQHLLKSAVQRIAKYNADRLEKMLDNLTAKQENLGVPQTAMSMAFKQAGVTIQSALEKTISKFSKSAANAIVRVAIVDTEYTGKQLAQASARLLEVDRQTGTLIREIERYSGSQRIGNMKLGTAVRMLSKDGKLPKDLSFLGHKIPAREWVDSAGVSGLRIQRMLAKADLVLGHYPMNTRGQMSDVQALSLLSTGGVPAGRNRLGYVPRPFAAEKLPWLDTSKFPWRTMGFPNGKQETLMRYQLGIREQRHLAEPDVDALQKILFSSSTYGQNTSFMKLLFNRAIPGPQTQVPSLSIDEIRKRSLMYAQGRGGDAWEDVGKQRELAKLLADQAKEMKLEALGQLRESTRRINGGTETYRGKRMLATPSQAYMGLGYERVRQIMGPGRYLTRSKYSHAGHESTPPGLSESQILSLDAKVRTLEEFERNAMITDPGRTFGSAARAAYSSMSENRLPGRRGDDILLSIFRTTNRQIDLNRVTPVHNRPNLSRTYDRGYERQQAIYQSMLDQPWAQRSGTFGRHEIEELIESPPLAGLGIPATAAQMANQVGPRSHYYQALLSVMGSSQAAARQQAEQARQKALYERYAKIRRGESIPLSSSSSGFQMRPFDELMSEWFPKAESRATASSPISRSLAPISPQYSREEYLAMLRKLQQSESGRSGSSFTNPPPRFMVWPKRKNGERGFLNLGGLFSSSKSKFDESVFDDMVSSARTGGLPKAENLRQSMRQDALKAKLNKLLESIDVARKSFERLSDAAAGRNVEKLATSKSRITSLGEQEERKITSLREREAQAQMAFDAQVKKSAAAAITLKKSKLFQDATPEERSILTEVRVTAPKDRAAARLQAAQDATRNEIPKIQAKTAERIRLEEEKVDRSQSRARAQVNTARENLQRKVDSAKAQGEGAVKSYFKRDAAAGGSGGGGGIPRTGGMGGFGVGLFALVEMDTAVKNFIKDSAIYAARTQLMEVATQNMAKVAGLNTQQVNAEVESMKRLNITTQQAQSVAQRMMMSQVDLSKATQLVRVAQDLAAVSGQDAMETTQRLMTAVVTGYTRNLHMLGLQVTSQSVMQDLRIQRRAEGKKGEPTEIEKRQALVNRIILEGAKVSGTYERTMLTAGGQFAYLRKEIQETMNALGQEFLPTFTRVMSSLSGGMHFVQEHAEGFAKLTSAVASLGVALSTVATGRFLAGVLSGSRFGPVGAAVGAAVGLGSYMFLNQDRSTSVGNTGKEAMDRLHAQQDTLKTNIVKLYANRSDTPEWRQAVAENVANLKATGKTEVDIQQDITHSLAEIFEQRVKDYDIMTKLVEGKQVSFMDATKHAEGTSTGLVNSSVLRASEYLGLYLYSALPEFLGGTNPLPPGTNIHTGGGIRAGVAAQVAGRTGISPEKILEEAQNIEDAKQTFVAPNLMNIAAMQAQQMVSVFRQAQTEMSKLDEKYNVFTGSAEKRARKMFGSPEQKMRAEYDVEVEQLDQLAEVVKKTKSNIPTTPLEKERLKKFYEGVGAMGLSGPDAVDQFLGTYEGVRKNIYQTKVAEPTAQLTAQTDVRVKQIEAETAADKIRSKVVQGNYASERAAIEETYQLQKKTAENVFKITQSGSEKRIAMSEAGADRERASIALTVRHRNAQVKLSEVAAQYLGELGARTTFQKTGLTSEQAVTKAFQARFAAAMSITDEDERQQALQKLMISREEDLYKVGEDRKRQAAEIASIEFNSHKRTSAEVNRAINIRRRSPEESALAAIDENRQLIRDAAQDEFLRMTKLNPPEGVTREQYDADLGNRRRQQEQAADEEAVIARAKELAQQRETVRQRLVSSLDHGLSIQEKGISAQADGDADQVAATMRIHQMRLDFAQKEYAARISYGRSEEEAERERLQKVAAAEESVFEDMAARRKKYLDSVRGTAEQLFEVVSTGHAKGLRDFLLGQVRGLGAHIFGNIAVEAMKNGRGLSLPGLTKPDGTPTRLGKILSGTILGTKVPTEKEVTDQLKKATDANSLATDRNTEALMRLSNLLHDLEWGYLSQNPPSPGPWIPQLPGAAGPGGDLVNIFGGAASNNPMIMHFDPSSPSISSGPMIFPGVGAGGGIASIVPSIASIALSGGLSPHFAASSSSMTPHFAVSKYSQNPALISDILKKTTFAQFAPKTSAQGFGATASWLSGQLGDAGGGSGAGTIMAGFPGLGKLGSKVGSKASAGAMAGAGIYQAVKNFGHGARGDVMGVGGVLGAAAGIAALIPGLQAAAPFLALGALVTDMIGGLFQDPKEARSNQISNLLGMSRYLSPATLSLSTSAKGTMVSEGRAGVTDTGIPISALQIIPPALLQQWGSSFLSFSGKPNVGPTSNLSGLFGGNALPTAPYQYADIPGQVLYSQLPGNIQPPATPFNLTVNALDSQSILDRSPDIAAALQKELMTGSSMSQSLQNSVFGVG